MRVVLFLGDLGMSVATGNVVRTQNRWIVAAAGVITQMVLGSVYGWSVLKTPLMEARGWSSAQVGLAFTLLMLSIGVVVATCGRYVDRAGARKVATLAAILFGSATMLAGVSSSLDSLWVLWVGYGVIGGVGNGLGYLTPIAVLVRWFPDKRGFITGLAVMGYGLGGATMGQIAPLIIPHVGVSATFLLFGVAFMLVLLIAAQQLNNPPEGWSPTLAADASGCPAVAVATESCDLAAALRMYQLYLLWGVLFVNVTAGLALISNLSPMAQAQVGLTPVAAGTLVLVASLFNGLGRIFWAALSDRIGRKATFLLILGTQVPLLLVLPSATNPWVFGALCCYILLCYGGGFATMPAFAADTFGTRCMGDIYGKILMAWGVAGVFGPMLMEYVKTQSGSYEAALFVAAGMLSLGVVLVALYRKPVVAPRVSGDNVTV